MAGEGHDASSVAAISEDQRDRGHRHPGPPEHQAPAVAPCRLATVISPTTSRPKAGLTASGRTAVLTVEVVASPSALSTALSRHPGGLGPDPDRAGGLLRRWGATAAGPPRPDGARDAASTPTAGTIDDCTGLVEYTTADQDADR